MATKKGTVKWFDTSRKGFGFITDEDGKDIFVHRNGIEEGRTYVGLEQGDTVEFDLEESKNGKGPHAVGVKLVTGEKTEEAETTEE